MTKKKFESGPPDWDKIRETLKQRAAIPKETEVEKAVRENYGEIILARENGYNTNEVCDWLREGGVDGVYSKSLNAALKKEEQRRSGTSEVEYLFAQTVNYFTLPQPDVEELEVERFYLMKGKESAKIVSIRSIIGDKVQYQIYGDSSGKSYSSRASELLKVLRGPITQENLGSVLKILENKQN